MHFLLLTCNISLFPNNATITEKSLNSLGPIRDDIVILGQESLNTSGPCTDLGIS